MNGDPLNVIKEADLSLFEQINRNHELAFQDGEITAKNKLLIALAIDAAHHAEDGIKSLAILALKAGASKNEILETLRIVNFICGVGSIYAAAGALEDIL
jgi:alkylhydroperoxidase/carboxymuconolactone decarboxylase family protein YurZ